MKIFYTPKQNAGGEHGFSPSAGKPKQAVASWIEKYGDKLEVVEPISLTVMDFALAHEKVFVEDILSQKSTNGFGDTSKEVAESLPWNNGSLFSAAKYAVENGTIAVSPTSGFHHAGWSYNGGFCTFNGLMITAAKLKEEGFVSKVGILDLDMHYGDGTDNIIKKLEAEEWVHHFTAGAEYHSAGQAEEFLQSLPEKLEKFAEFGIDVLLFQAGADCHISDPLGGWLNSEQIRRRDKIVFEFCRDKNIPVAWCLAGGYQKSPDGSIGAVLDIHDATIEEGLIAYGFFTRDQTEQKSRL